MNPKRLLALALLALFGMALATAWMWGYAHGVRTQGPRSLTLAIDARMELAPPDDTGKQKAELAALKWQTVESVRRVTR